MNKFAKYVFPYIIIFISSVFIYVTTEFEITGMYKNILTAIEVLILLIFSFYLIKNIKTKKIDYSLDSFRSYIGIIGVNLIILGLFHFGLIYPLSYTLHQVTKNTRNIEMKIIHKEDYTSTTRYLKKYRYKLWLKNSDFERIVYLNDNQVSKKDYDKINVNNIIFLNVEKSFFGYIINKLEYTTGD